LNFYLYQKLSKIIENYAINYHYRKKKSHRTINTILAGGHPFWKVQLDGRIEATAAASGNGQQIFIGTYSGTMYSLAASTGQELWKYSSKDMIKSTPLVFKSRVIFGGHDGLMNAVTLDKGQLIWQRSVGAPVLASPIGHSTNLICGTLKGRCLSLKQSDGLENWSVLLDSPVFSTPKPFINQIIVASVKGFVYSLSAHNGEVRWKVGLDSHVFSSVASSMIMDPMLAFVGTQGG
jgi:outer membrane protein assembly factor BamB